MARPRSAHVRNVKAALAARLNSGLAEPGGRFLSTRLVARHYNVSYQTAHILMSELATEGRLLRKSASGSYLPGPRRRLRGAQLIFAARSRRKGSFGASLRERLETALAERNLPFVRSWADDPRVPPLRPDFYPVIWECRTAVHAAVSARRFALCLNDHPPPGLGGGLIDAITTDDFSGGACAAELLKARTGHAGGFAVLGGPRDDPRSQGRIAGFCAHARDVRVVAADSWFLEEGQRHAAAILALRPTGIFACNDRLAEAILVCAATRRVTPPPLVGFDDAPVAGRRHLTTIGIPWASLVAHAIELIAARIAGDSTPAKVVTLPHEPVVRLTA